MSDEHDPAAAEVTTTPADTVSITFDGQDYEVPATADDLDITVLRAFSSQDIMGIVEGIFGPRRFAALERRHREANDGKFTVSSLKPLVDKVAELYGFGSAGE